MLLKGLEGAYLRVKLILLAISAISLIYWLVFNFFVTVPQEYFFFSHWHSLLRNWYLYHCIWGPYSDVTSHFSRAATLKKRLFIHHVWKSLIRNCHVQDTPSVQSQSFLYEVLSFTSPNIEVSTVKILPTLPPEKKMTHLSLNNGVNETLAFFSCCFIDSDDDEWQAML